MNDREFDAINLDLIALFGPPGKPFMKTLYRKVSGLTREEYASVVDGLICTFKPKYRGDFPSVAAFLEAHKTSLNQPNLDPAEHQETPGERDWRLLQEEISRLPFAERHALDEKAERLMRERHGNHWDHIPAALEGAKWSARIEIYCDETGKKNPILEGK